MTVYLDRNTHDRAVRLLDRYSLHVCGRTVEQLEVLAISGHLMREDECRFMDAANILYQDMIDTEQRVQ